MREMRSSASLAALLLLLLAACPRSGGRPPDPAAPRPPPMAQRGSDAIVDDAWGLGLLVDPAVAESSVDGRHFAVDTVSRGNLEAGVFSFRAEVAPVRARAGSRTLAADARESWQRAEASEISEITEVTFLGHPGHALTFHAKDSYGLQVVTVVGTCVLELVVLRSGHPDWMTQYASDVLRNVKSLTGKPVEPKPCR